MNELLKYKVVKNEQPTEGLCRLFLVPEDEGKVIDFSAGQFVMISQLNEKGELIRKRSYSIASAPQESSNQIELGIRRQGKMSNYLCDAKAGDVINLQGPYGRFTLNEKAKKIVYFAGGVGMTPFRSLIREALAKGIDQDMVLFYSAPTRKDLMYHEEFKKMAQEHNNFLYIPITTRECPEGWEGECRRLDQEMILKYVPDLTAAEYMMCGPVDFMKTIKDVLTNNGVDVAAKLRFERY